MLSITEVYSIFHACIEFIDYSLFTFKSKFMFPFFVKLLIRNQFEVVKLSLLYQTESKVEIF